MTTTPHPICNTEYDFTLLLDEGISDVNQSVEDALFEAGCDDATISVRFGRVFLNFSRSAQSFRHAIISAICNVRDAKIGASVFRVDACDLVTQAEIARRMDRTRQLVNLYISGARGPGSFPPPACNIADGQPLWFWCEVAQWLWQNSLIKEEVLQRAQEVTVINNLLEFEYQKQLTPELTRQISEALSLCGCET
ncbi:MAG: hypothetical protein IID28_14440 [Planctomycetes bacterium]|nr:hypothetical protein [Planctomycetota bacterium]